jgi:carboxypeptidase Q
MKNLLIFCLLLVALSAATIEKDYTDFVLALKDKINAAPFRHSAYDRLAYITDTYGPRMWGSMALEQCIYEIASMASKEGFENVRLEQVKNFTKWVRGT